MKEKRFSFKRVFFAYIFATLPFFLLGSVLTLLNITPVTANGKEYHGIDGFLSFFVWMPFFCILFTILNWLVLNFGNYLYVKIFKIFGKEVED